jgi:hypothetical protein
MTGDFATQKRLLQEPLLMCSQRESCGLVHVSMRKSFKFNGIFQGKADLNKIQALFSTQPEGFPHE